jgi:hypothetical protein
MNNRLEELRVMKQRDPGLFVSDAAPLAEELDTLERIEREARGKPSDHLPGLVFIGASLLLLAASLFFHHLNH